MTARARDFREFLAGGGATGARIAAMDWSRSELGPIERWPETLRHGLGMILASPFPMYIAWGPRLVFLCNDAYVPLTGERDVLGIAFEEAWPELWDSFRPLAEATVRGESSFHENMPLTLHRFGQPEQTFFTFAYSPVRNDDGGPGGLLCAVLETTNAVMGMQRHRLAWQLTDRLRDIEDPLEIARHACRTLGEHLHAKRVGFADIEDARNEVLVRQGWHDGSVSSVVGASFALDGFGHGVRDELVAGRTVCIDNVAVDPRCVGGPRIYDAMQLSAAVLVPLTRRGELVAVFAAGTGEPRHWREEEVRLAEDTADRTRAAMEHARAERVLREREAGERRRLEVLFHQAPSFMAVLSGPDHVYTLSNASHDRLIGHRAVLGKPFAEAMPDIAAQGFGALLDAVYENGMPFVATEAAISLVAADGESRLRFLDFVYQPIFDADGKVTDIFVEGNDVTERKLAADALRESDRRKDEFLAMLAHELRNPLAPIRSAAEVLRFESPGADVIRQASAVVHRQVLHMTRLVDDLLDVSRVTRGKVTLQRHPVDMKAIVATAIEQTRPAMEARGHALGVQLAADGAHVFGDESRLVQVVANLLNNAAKFTPERGHVWLRLETRDERVVLQVSDDGAGIAPEAQNLVFELFWQADRSGERATGGLGLGLALVRSVVELHGGTVACRSDGPGRGTTFEIVLPRHRGGLATPAAAIPERRIDDAGTRVLLVDDNVDAADLLGLYLGTCGLDVTVSNDSHRALEIAGRLRPHACVLDIGMPGLDGYGLAAALRDGEATRDALLIALTGFGQPNDRERALAAGFDLHLVKPVDAEALRRAIADGLADRPPRASG
jgi:signal transduction histidine kinase/ActR/RegA family two-component response regulator